MGQPKSGLNPTTNSVGFTAKLVTVQSVSADGKSAVCVDRLNTQTTVSMLVQRSKGPLPQPGESWLLAQDLGIWAFAAFVASTPADFAISGGSAGITVSAQAPEAPSTGELWLNASAGFELLEWTGLQWNPLQFGTSALADKSVTAAKIADGTITSAQIAPNAGIQASQVAFTAGDIGGTRIFKGTSQPSGMKPGDMWFNPSQGNQISEWDGSEWRLMQLGAPAIAPGSLTAEQLAAEAGITAGQVAFTYKDLGGMSITIAPESPASPADGDLWFDSTNGYAFRQWNGTAWVPYQFGTNALAAGSVTAELIGANAIIAGKIAVGAVQAGNIEAGTIVAGIVDGTLIQAATFLGSIFEGSDFVINSLGMFFYSGTPGAGNLIASITPAAGSNDGEGNPFMAGFTVYDGTAHIQIHINQSGPYPAIDMATGLASEYAHPAIFVQPLNAGAANESELLRIIGAASTFDNQTPQMWMQGSAKDGSSTAAIYADHGGGFSGLLALTETDVTNRTATPNNTPTQISGSWTIPANDPKAGTVYKITALGAGSQVASGNNWLFSVGGYGSANEATCIVTASSIYTGGVAVMYEGWIQIISTGTSGKAHFHSRVTISPNNSAATDANSIVVTGRTNGVTINTTTATAMELYGAINGTVAGANFGCETSYIERLGP